MISARTVRVTEAAAIAAARETCIGVTYLNTAYMGPLPRTAVEAGWSALDRKARPWTIVAEDFFERFGWTVADHDSLEADDLLGSLADAEVWNLIFAPGFSTAEVVSDVSGRGVGMDVVKRNITALGGTVEIDSAEGHGMKVSVRLPLTLAIMDGMSIGIGNECYIVPLASVVESFQVAPGTVRTLGGTARVVEVRDEFMPVVDLEQVFRVPRDAPAASSIMVVVEAEGGRVALRVDELIGQQQVVVKNLESNYRRVDDVSGATILGDGRVALILDVASLVRRSRH